MTLDEIEAEILEAKSRVDKLADRIDGGGNNLSDLTFLCASASASQAYMNGLLIRELAIRSGYRLSIDEPKGKS